MSEQTDRTPPHSWELCQRCGALFEAGKQCPFCPARQPEREVTP